MTEASDEPPNVGGFRALQTNPRYRRTSGGFIKGMTDSQHEDGYAWTWEPAVGALTTVAILGVMALQAGRSLTLLIAGEGWQWPPSTALVTSCWGILTGNLHAGVTPTNPVTGSVVLAWALAGALFIAGLAAATTLALRVVAGRRFKGMASAGQAEQLLGLGRLRANRAVIRPDLYRTGQRR